MRLEQGVVAENIFHELERLSTIAGREAALRFCNTPVGTSVQKELSIERLSPFMQRIVKHAVSGNVHALADYLLIGINYGHEDITPTFVAQKMALAYVGQAESLQRVAKRHGLTPLGINSQVESRYADETAATWLEVYKRIRTQSKY